MGCRKLEGSDAVAVQQHLVLANEPCALVFSASSKLWPLNSYIAARVSTRLTAVSCKVRSSAAPIGTLPMGPDRPPRCCWCAGLVQALMFFVRQNGVARNLWNT